MKKKLSLVLALALMLSLAACGGQSNPPTNSNMPPAAASPDTPSAGSTADPEPSGDIIPAHPTCRIALRPEAQPLFWTYFSENPAKQRWGHVVMKYFANETAGNILFDLWNTAKQPEERETLEKFYQYFCRLNRLSPREQKEGAP